MSEYPCSHEEGCLNKTDEEIVKMVIKNEDCFVCLVDRYEEKLIRYIKRISGVSDENAEDILQDVFFKVYRNLKSFDPELKFSSWIYRITHNETINYWRRNKKRKDGDVSWDDNDALKSVIRDEEDVEESVYQKINNEVLKRAVGRLNEKYRTVLVLSYFEGKSYQEIADILNKPIGTVGTLINRAKKKLKSILLDKGVDSLVANKK